MDLTIEQVRAWLSTGILGSILIVLLRYGRPLIEFWIEKRRLDLQEKTQTSQDRRAEEEARHKLTIDLLSAARSEAAQLESKLQQVDFDEKFALHMDEALRHIEALVNAENEAELTMAIRLARAFLTRMKRVMEMKGTWANERQRERSAAMLSQRTLPKPSPDNREEE